MELRSDRWEETHDFDTLYQFKWHPISRGIKFDLVGKHGTKQLVNHFENHHIFTTKDNMFRNAFSHCEAKKLNVFEYVPLTFILEVDSIYSAQEYEKFLNYFTHIEKMSQLVKDQQESLETALKQINTKFMHGYSVSKEERIGASYAKMTMPPSHFQAQNMWILKATGFNRGIGIHVFNKLEELHRFIKEYTEGTVAEGNILEVPQVKKIKTQKEESSKPPL
jgi:hypothetical protein